MSKSDAQREAEARYRRKMHQIVVRYSPSDIDIFEHIMESGGASYLKRLVAEDIERAEMTLGGSTCRSTADR